MKKVITIILLCLCIVCSVFGQSMEITDYVDMGVVLHDKGDYKGAIEQYKSALKIE